MSTPHKHPSYKVHRLLNIQFVTINGKVFIPDGDGVIILYLDGTTRFINNSWYQ